MISIVATLVIILSTIVFSFTVTNSLLILFFALPLTKKLEKIKFIIPNNNIYNSYLIALGIQILIFALYTGAFSLLSGDGYFISMLVGYTLGVFSLVSKRSEIGMNRNNFTEYFEKNKQYFWSLLVTQSEKEGFDLYAFVEESINKPQNKKIIPQDNTKYKLDARFEFSAEEFERIKKGYERRPSMDYRWYITCENNYVNILRSWNPTIMFKVPFERVGDKYISKTTFSAFDVNSDSLEQEISKQNYWNFWIYSLISQLIFDEPPLMIFDVLVHKTKLDFNSVHGFTHWRSVYRTGKTLFKDIDLTVLFYFSVFHDFYRLNDYNDPEHGKRALNCMPLVKLEITEEQANKLAFAMEHHTLAPEEFFKLDNNLKNDETVQACIDCDRLDLGRVGEEIDTKQLLSKSLKNR